MIIRGTSRSMPLCGREEADTRILFHLQDALATGSTTCLVPTVDTDVVVIIIGKFHTLLTKHPAADIWIAFRTGKNFTYMHIIAIYHALGKDKYMSLPIFHCFTGCDTTSAFFGKDKKSTWETWNSYPEVTAAFIYMSTHPHTPLTKEFSISVILNALLLFFMTRLAVWDLLMKHRESYSVKRIGPWRAFQRCRMPCCSTASV